MFGHRITLFRLFGFAVRIDLSWLIVAALITWSLATGAFPELHPGLKSSTYWAMGLAGALALFLSIVVHEFSHAMVARRFGIPMRGITLFLFGGVAEMEEEPKSARAEFLMAIAGPIASVVVAALFGLAAGAMRMIGWQSPVVAVFGYLATINVVLVIFNMLPAFPLDGGRVLRAILWARKKDLRGATRIAAQTGNVFGWLLIVLGLVSVFFDQLVGGIWWFLIGMFIRNAAAMSYQQVLVRETLAGEPVSRFMKENPVTVQRSIPVRELVEDFIYKHHFKLFPVLDGERLIGCVTTRDVHNLPRDQWDSQTVGSITAPCSEANSVAPTADAMQALSKMSGSGVSRLLVIDDGRLAGVLTVKDLLGFLSLKMELEKRP
jgi:Zn-dependent protease